MEFATHLETGRLQLRAVGSTDMAFIAALIGDEDVRLFLGGPVPVVDREATARSYLVVDSGEAAWVVETKVARQPVGLVFISSHRDGVDSELSFMFSPKVWGRGYAIEATQRLLDHATKEVGLARLIAETQSANQASCRLLERLGMSEHGRVQRFGAEQIIYTTS